MADFELDFESTLAAQQQQQTTDVNDVPASEAASLKDKPRNYRQTVCTYWIRGLCMKGDACGFLHQFEASRMPVCRNLLKNGVCKDLDCPYKHTTDEIKECNMYKLGFCIYGPACRYKHTRSSGPPPDPTMVEAAKPREFRNITLVANQANQGISQGGVRRYRAPENQNQLMLEGSSRGRGGNGHPFGSGANASALGPKLPAMRMGA